MIFFLFKLKFIKIYILKQEEMSLDPESPIPTCTKCLTCAACGLLPIMCARCAACTCIAQPQVPPGAPLPDTMTAYYKHLLEYCEHVPGANVVRAMSPEELSIPPTTPGFEDLRECEKYVKTLLRHSPECTCADTSECTLPLANLRMRSYGLRTYDRSYSSCGYPCPTASKLEGPLGL